MKEREVENEPLFQQNNLKLQRDMDEHKLKVFDYFLVINIDSRDLKSRNSK